MNKEEREMTDVKKQMDRETKALERRAKKSGRSRSKFSLIELEGKRPELESA